MEEEKSKILKGFAILLMVYHHCFCILINYFYAIAFIILFANATSWKYVNKFLKEMGKHSTSIWFIHTYFCYYLFHDFIYGFKYPIVIFLVLLACSFLSAVVIDWINGKVQVLINSYVTK